MRRVLFGVGVLSFIALAGLAQVAAPPVSLTLSASPPSLFVNQEGTITIKISAGEAGARPPADLFLVVDRSATVNVREIEKIGSAIIEALSPQDRVGLVSFGTDARVDVPLTFDHEAVRTGLKLLKPLGKTAVGEGIAKALDTLVINGREEASWAMILLSDGRFNTGRTPLSQAQRAAESGVAIFTVATGRNPDRTLLRELARLTQGQFFEQFTETVPQQIAQALGKKIVARQIKITLVLPAFVNYGIATFNAPNRVTKNPDNTTTIVWEIDGLAAGETFEASFTVSGSQPGTAVLRPSLSFLDARGRLFSPPVKELSLIVRDRNRPPTVNFEFLPAEPKANEPITFIDRSTDDVRIVAWEWNFGDGTSASEQNPVHRYRADGSYSVTLTVTDTDGERASATKTNPEPRVIKLSGSISSAAPAFELTTTGETEIRVVTKLPLPVIFARMDVSDPANPKVNLWLETNTISFEQMQVAVSKFWLNNESVKNRPDGKVDFGKIDIKTLQILVAYWLTGASVFGPLP
jgi:uncharacterized protein YegL